MKLTPEQQKETALRLYRLAWRFPERAPSAIMSEFGDGLHSRAARMAWMPGMKSVSATCRKTGVCTVTIDVGDSQSLHIQGTPGYVETMLRAIPYSLRPHVEESK